jgi:anthranilate phosphoribosyltransferase
MIREAIRKVVEGFDLSADEAKAAMDVIMAGEATDAQIAALITALRMKGETPDEIAGFARTMREKCVRVRTTREPLIDTCGTGGDRLDTFNISTAAAFVAAGAGVGVAKHGNRSVTSQCGSADVLQTLGIDIELPAEWVGRCIDQVGIGFLFAPLLHPSMKYAIGPRRQIGIRTVFNILGPLTNPAGARRQVVGVYDAALTEPLALALAALGCERALVVHGLDGLDELSTLGETQVSELRDGAVRTYVLRPEDVGLQRVSPEAIEGGEPAECARRLLDVLEGEPGPARDVVLLNAAGAVYVAGLAESIREGLDRARESIDGGDALHALHALRDFVAG